MRHKTEGNGIMNEELLQNETLTMADLEAHFDDANPWNVVADYMEKGTVLPVKIEGIVNGGAIAMVEGLRGFIPASKLSLNYVEDLESYLLQDIDVQVIDVDQANNRLVLSARELLKEKARKEKEAQIASVLLAVLWPEQLKHYRTMVLSFASKTDFLVLFIFLRSARNVSKLQKML